MAFKEQLANWLSEKPSFADLHLQEGRVPRVREDTGVLRQLQSMAPLTADDLCQLVEGVMPNLPSAVASAEGQIDFTAPILDYRFRCNAYQYDDGKLGLAMRYVKDTVPALDGLGLPPRAQEFPHKPSGLVLVTGVTGSGKSTTLASMVAKRAEQPGHIITIEDPIEYVHASDSEAIITQRAIGRDSENFAGALRGALRQDPDVIMVGEIRDPETAEIALKAADTGHLVLATLHTRSAARTIERLVNLFPPGLQAMVQHQLADTIVGVLSQVLVPRADGNGRVLAAELMTMERGIPANIRNNRLDQLNADISQASKDGMQLLNEALARHVRDEVITLDAALAASYEPADLSKRFAGRSRL